MNQKKFCSLELAQQLKEKGFDLPCEYIYVNRYRVKDEIQEKYPGLSDCGYDELTKKWGGELEEDEVYGQYVDPYRECIRNSYIKPDEKMRLCTMPTLDDARTWLRDKHFFHIVVTPEPCCFKAILMLPSKFGVVGGVHGATAQIYNPEYLPAHEKSTTFESYEEALQTALLEAMRYVGKWNAV